MATTNAFLRTRYDLAANWSAQNPMLLQGEMGIESDTLRFKVGDGGTAWNGLTYLPYTVDDEDFLILDNTDQTKGIRFLTAGQTTGFIRTVTPADKDITLDDEDDPRPVRSPYTIADLDDRITDGNAIIISDAAPNLQGFLGDVAGGGVGLIFSTTGLFDPLNGGIFCGAGGTIIAGSAVQIDSLGRGVVSEVFADAVGNLFAQDPPEPGWTESDTDAGSYDLGTGTGVGTNTLISGLQVTVPVGGEIDPGEQLTVFVTLHAVNKTGDRTGDLEIGFGINGAAPTGWSPRQISGGFNGFVSAGLVSSSVTLVATDTIEVWARINNGSNLLYGVDITGGTHEMNAEKAGESGTPVSGEANTTSNQGGGVALALVKAGVDLPFRTLNATEFELSGNLAQLRAAGIALSKLATDPLARANHTGTQPLATISDRGALASADTITAITEIDAALRSGADLILVTGTAGPAGNLAHWNADGDIEDGGPSPVPPVDTTEFNAGSQVTSWQPDTANGVNQRAQLSGATQLGVPTNLGNGGTGLLHITTNGHALTFNASFKIPEAPIPVSGDFVSLSYAFQNGDCVLFGGSYS